MGRVTIAPMRTRHLRRVAELEERCFDRPWSRAVLAGEVSAANRIYRIARSAGEVVGYAGAMILPPDAHILTLAVASGMRRRGVASLLVAELLYTARSWGVRNATLEVRESNTGARALYEGLGFRSVGRRTAYYEDEDAIVMWRVDRGWRNADGGPRSPHPAFRSPQSGRKAAS